MMGFDVWAEGSSREDYLEGCRASAKYKKGTWFVLSDGSRLLSSLIVYDFGNQKFGIGSIATPPDFRKRGYASESIQSAISYLEDKVGALTLYLYSDIEPDFYEKFGFVRLQPDGQRYKTTTCMVRSKNLEKYLGNKIESPEYF